MPKPSVQRSKAALARLEQQVALWCARPIEVGISRGQQLLDEIQGELRRNAGAKSALGPLLGKVKGIQKRLSKLEKVNWVSVLGGCLAIGHRPGGKMFADLKLLGATHIVTLLSESEGAAEMRRGTNKEGMQWLWFPMSSANPPQEATLADLQHLFISMARLMEQGGKLYLHCSAGIHRTGMITHAFLRAIGMGETQALATLAQLRLETRDCLTPQRLAWSNAYGPTIRLGR